MAYVVITVKAVLDSAAMQEYRSKVTPIIERHGGTYAAMEPNAEVKAGEWPYLRTLLIKFPSFEEAQNWYNSAEYQAIVPIRLKAMDANIALIHEVSETTK